jgi:hypothetical protein
MSLITFVKQRIYLPNPTFDPVPFKIATPNRTQSTHPILPIKASSYFLLATKRIAHNGYPRPAELDTYNPRTHP